MKNDYMLLVFSLVFSVNVAFAETRIGGTLFVDANSNSFLDSAETPITGIGVSLMSEDRNTIFGQSYTDANGVFEFRQDFVLPRRTYYFVIDRNPSVEPLLSSHPTVTVSIGYQALKVKSGRSGSSSLNFNIGYAPGICGMVRNLPVVNARRNLDLIRAELLRSSSGLTRRNLFSTAEKLAGANFGLSAIKTNTYRCGVQGNLCTQTNVKAFRKSAITNVSRLNTLITKSKMNESGRQKIAQLVSRFKIVATGIADVVEDCS